MQQRGSCRWSMLCRTQGDLYLVARLLTTEDALEWFGQWSAVSDRINIVYLALTLIGSGIELSRVRSPADCGSRALVVLGMGSRWCSHWLWRSCPKHGGHWLLDRSMASLLSLPFRSAWRLHPALSSVRIDLFINRAWYTARSPSCRGMWPLLIVVAPRRSCGPTVTCCCRSSPLA